MNKFEKAVQKIFKAEEGDIRDEMSPKTMPNWDSFNYLMFISELEDVFGIKFTMDEVMTAKTLGDIKGCLIKRGIRL